MKNRRYIFDALYGEIHLPDFIWDVLMTPEVQRLREIRLCNINSLSLTGGANINRFEHAIGTCHLAIKCYESWLFKKAISDSEMKAFFIAALIHDVANAAFGHSIEYVEGYKPEDSVWDIILGRKGDSFTSKKAKHEIVFFGLYGTLYNNLIRKLKLTEKDLEIIANAIQGKGLFGPIISNSIDLDNIDNVYRMAYHLGLISDKTIPLKLATSLIIDDGILKIEKKNISLLNDWFETRKLLYEFLLLNPDEFAGKSMLTEAIENAKLTEKFPFRWFDTDFELLNKLVPISSENAELIPRLMTGDLYGCICIFSSTQIGFYKDFLDVEKRNAMEKEIETKIRAKYQSLNQSLKSALISLHPIVDVNKTERVVNIISTDNEPLTIGYSSKQLLIGVFFKNRDLNMNHLREMEYKWLPLIQDDIKEYLSYRLNDRNIKNLELFSEVKQYKGNEE